MAIEGVSRDGARAKTGQYLVPHLAIRNPSNKQGRAHQLKMAHAKLRYRVTARLILRLSLSMIPSTTSLSKLSSSSNRCGPECSEPSLLGAVFLLLSKSSLSILPDALGLELRDRIVGYCSLVIISSYRSVLWCKGEMRWLVLSTLLISRRGRAMMIMTMGFRQNNHHMDRHMIYSDAGHLLQQCIHLLCWKWSLSWNS